MTIQDLLKRVGRLGHQQSHLKIQSSIIFKAGELMEAKYRECGPGHVEVTARDIAHSLRMADRLPAIMGAMKRIAAEIEGFGLSGRNSQMTLKIEVSGEKTNVVVPKESPAIELPNRFYGRTPGKARVLVLGLFHSPTDGDYHHHFAKSAPKGWDLASSAYESALFPVLHRLAEEQARSNGESMPDLKRDEWPPLLMHRFSVGCMDVVSKITLPDSDLPLFKASGLTDAFISRKGVALDYGFEALDHWMQTPDAQHLKKIVAFWGGRGMIPSVIAAELTRWEERFKSQYPGVFIQLFSGPNLVSSRKKVADLAKSLELIFKISNPENPSVGTVEGSFEVILRPTYRRQGFINSGVTTRSLFPKDNEVFDYEVWRNGKRLLSHSGRVNLRANPNQAPRLMLTVSFANAMQDYPEGERLVCEIVRHHDTLKLKLELY